MARVHLKRVLELNPNHSIALKYSRILEKRVAEKRKADSQVLQPDPKVTKAKPAKEQPWFKRILGR